jgi:hypothetical protein
MIDHPNNIFLSNASDPNRLIINIPLMGKSNDWYMPALNELRLDMLLANYHLNPRYLKETLVNSPRIYDDFLSFINGYILHRTGYINGGAMDRIALGVYPSVLVNLINRTKHKYYYFLNNYVTTQDHDPIKYTVDNILDNITRHIEIRLHNPITKNVLDVELYSKRSVVIYQANDNLLESKPGLNVMSCKSLSVMFNPDVFDTTLKNCFK